MVEGESESMPHLRRLCYKVPGFEESIEMAHSFASVCICYAHVRKQLFVKNCVPMANPAEMLRRDGY